MPLTTDKPQEQELKSEALIITQRATAIKIVDQNSYDCAVEVLTNIKTFRKRWKDYWEPLRDGAYKSYKAILDKFNEGDSPLDKAESAVKRNILAWDDQQRRIQEEQQREAQRKAEEEARAAQAQQAFEMEQDGASDEDIEALMEQPAPIAEPVQPTYQKASSVSRRENWKARVTNMKALCKAIGAGKVPVEYVEPNMTALNARAKADKSTMAVPGVEAYDDPNLSARTR